MQEKAEKAPKPLGCLSLIEKSRPRSFPLGSLKAHLILPTARGALTEKKENPETPVSQVSVLRLGFRQGQDPWLVWI